jgi:hypothetical protein
VTVSGQDTLIWFTLDNVRSINIVDLSLQATARALLYEQQKVDSLTLQVKQIREALFRSEITYNTAIELTQSKQNEIYESQSVISQLNKELKRAKNGAKWAKTAAFVFGIVAVIEAVMLGLLN